MSFFARAVTKSALGMAFARSMSTEAAPAIAARQVVVPRPRGQIDTPESFLKAIGRGCEKYTEKFKDWDHLFKADTIKLKHELGIGAKQRKWILMWTNKFRLGIDPYLIRTSKKHTMKRTERLARAKRRRQD
ncbi:hypothetical protein IWW37_003003 [Coemansia sp. RSA 2050]|nr:hypothetical protein IWW37_003003 [Coemansia sp. RSA 2050]KAJ2733532.1 hypothetical protein IW152_002998 [Coemansia sp. BCRC 34962]